MADRKFVLEWDGPHSYHDWKEVLNDDAEYEGYSEAFSIYALTDTHPLYGDGSIVYIGMTDRNILSRLEEHSKNWWEGEAYLATVYPFKNWETYDDSNVNSALFVSSEKSTDLNEDLSKEILEIESLLIHALAPAYNSRNKKSANESSDIRLFSVGPKSKIPNEVSGRYTIWKTPKPEEIDEEQFKKFGLN